jgi:hypothetical protein
MKIDDTTFKQSFRERDRFFSPRLVPFEPIVPILGCLPLSVHATGQSNRRLRGETLRRAEDIAEKGFV